MRKKRKVSRNERIKGLIVRSKTKKRDIQANEYKKKIKVDQEKQT